MFIDWVVHDPFSRSYIVEQKPWLFKEDIVRLAERGVVVFLNSNDIRIIILPHGHQRNRIVAVLVMIRLDVPDEFVTVRDRPASAELGERRSRRGLKDQYRNG